MKKFITSRLNLSVAFPQAGGGRVAYLDIANTNFFGVHSFLNASAIVLGGSSELSTTTG